MPPGSNITIDHEYGDLMRAGRLVVFDRFLSELELRQCHAAIDLNCSVYVDFYGLSSLMLKSLAADVPVIANHHGWGSATVHRFMVGHTVDPHNTNAYAALLPEALDQCSSYQRTPAVKRLLNFHSIANFTDGMVERFAHQAQVGPSRKSLDWAWVMDGVRPECRALR